jgi:hypothetical protein
VRVTVPRAYIIGIAALFSALHVAIGLYSIRAVSDPSPVLAAIVLYAAATGASLVIRSTTSMSSALACADIVIVLLIVILASTNLDPAALLPSQTWYVAACGTLLTIVTTRHRLVFAWLGCGILVVHALLFGGTWLFLGSGVIGSVTWVAGAHAIGTGMARARADARLFADAEREATDWQALQEAHLSERQARLEKIGDVALAMLQVIRESGGELTAVQRQECLYLEGAIRDEIRGRRLLNDAVRRDVMAARRAGTSISLLDEGGLDDLDEAQRDRVLDRLADAIRATPADRLVIRTAQETSDVAVTVVGLRHPAASHGQTDEDDEVALWLEIPRDI